MGTLRGRAEAQKQTKENGYLEELGARIQESTEHAETIKQDIKKKLDESEQRRAKFLQKESEGGSAYNKFVKILKTEIEEAESSEYKKIPPELVSKKELTQCVFRRIPDTHSDSFRTVIPIHSGHPFRFISDSDSNPIRTVLFACLDYQI